MSNLIKTFLNDEAGASAAEYALILAIVGTAIVGGSILLGNAVSGAMSTAADQINNPATAV